MNRSTFFLRRMAFGSLFVLLLMALSGCKDDFVLSADANQSKLVVYCFPSPTVDTTYIDVNESLPVVLGVSPFQLWGGASGSSPDPTLRVTYTVNGESRKVSWSETKHRFFVVGSHAEGDRVDVYAEQEGFPLCHATTIVPAEVPITLDRVVRVRQMDSDDIGAYYYDQLQATFTDAPSTDYYAVRVRRMDVQLHVKGLYYSTADSEEPDITYLPNSYEMYEQLRAEHPDWQWTEEPLDTIYSYVDLNPDGETLLFPLSSLDEDLGYETTFYDNFYIFDDGTINGQTYTLHLNVRSLTSAQEVVPTKHFYQVRLYRLTPDYFKFLKSVNNLNDNDLATIGFSQIMPTHTNVEGGIGVVGAFNRSQTPWHQIFPL